MALSYVSVDGDIRATVRERLSAGSAGTTCTGAAVIGKKSASSPNNAAARSTEILAEACSILPATSRVAFSQASVIGLAGILSKRLQSKPEGVACANWLSVWLASPPWSPQPLLHRRESTSGLMVLRPSSRGLDIRTTLRGGDTTTILGRGLDTTTTLGRGLEFTTTLGRGVEAVNILGIRTPTRTADAAGPPSAVREAW